LCTPAPEVTSEPGPPRSHLRSARRSDAAGNPRAAGSRRSLGHGADGTVLHEPAGGLEAPEGAGAGRADLDRARGAAAAAAPRGTAARRGGTMARAVQEIVGSTVRHPRRPAGRAAGSEAETRTKEATKERTMTNAGALMITTPSDREILMTRLFD